MFNVISQLDRIESRLEKMVADTTYRGGDDDFLFEVTFPSTVEKPQQTYVQTVLLQLFNENAKKLALNYKVVDTVNIENTNGGFKVFYRGGDDNTLFTVTFSKKVKVKQRNSIRLLLVQLFKKRETQEGLQLSVKHKVAIEDTNGGFKLKLSLSPQPAWPPVNPPRDTTAAPRDTTAVPRDTTAVPRDTTAEPSAGRPCRRV